MRTAQCTRGFAAHQSKLSCWALRPMSATTSVHQSTLWVETAAASVRNSNVLATPGSKVRLSIRAIALPLSPPAAASPSVIWA